MCINSAYLMVSGGESDWGGPLGGAVLHSLADGRGVGRESARAVQPAPVV